MTRPVMPSLIAAISFALCSCSGDDSPTAPALPTASSSPTASSLPTTPSLRATSPIPNNSSPKSADACLKTASSQREMDILEAKLACPIEVGDKVRVKFVGTDETYGCSPQVVAVAPTSSPREYVRIAITHGSEKEYTAVVRLQNRVLRDRKSGWRTYGWPGNPPLEPCSELPMKIVGISCKVSGAADFQSCEDDIEVIAPNLFLSEELLQP